MSASNGHALRRSSRVPIRVPVRVTTLEPDAQLSEICETIVVNAHGFAVSFPMQLEAGSPLRLQSRGGRQTTAYVVICQPLSPDGQNWRLGARFDRPQNFWGLESCPEDWRVIEMPSPADDQSRQQTAAVVVRKQQSPSNASQAFIEKIEEQLSEDRLRGILARLMRPLQADVVELQEKLSRSGRQNRFEVSLGQIPPELEEKLWERLRQEVLALARRRFSDEARTFDEGVLDSARLVHLV